VIHERLVAKHGFTGHYQRIKVYVRENRVRLTAAEPEPVGFHRRFELLPAAKPRSTGATKERSPPPRTSSPG
jgi:hypothetical protein